MADKPRQRGPRPQSGDGRRSKAPPARFGPQAGKAKSQPARKRPGGIDERSLDVLEQQGLLTKEGQRLKASLSGTGTVPEQSGRRTTARGPGRPQGDSPLRDERPRKGPVKVGASGPRQLNPAEALVAERLHKVMAQAGVASRRHSEELIRAGRVTVNGRVVTEMGTKVLAGKDIIEVDGRPLSRPENLIHILLNKPKGYVTTLFDPQNRPKVVDLLGGEIGERVYPVGRLDFDTEGLLLLTNDGELANALMHPSRTVKKTYIAKVRGVPGPAKISLLEQGMVLDDGPTAPAEVKMIDVKAPNAATLSIRIHEGRNRQVRRMFEALDHEVIHLKRTTLGPLQIKDLMPGEWRELTDNEVNELRYAAGLKTMAAAREDQPRVGGPRQARVPLRAGARRKGPSPEEPELTPAPSPRRGSVGSPLLRGPGRADQGGEGRPTRTNRPVPRGDGPAPRGAGPVRRGDGPSPSAPRRDGTAPTRRDGPAQTRRAGPPAKGGGPSPRRAGPSPGRSRGPRP